VGLKVVVVILPCSTVSCAAPNSHAGGGELSVTSGGVQLELCGKQLVLGRHTIQEGHAEHGSCVLAIVDFIQHHLLFKLTSVVITWRHR